MRRKYDHLQPKWPKSDGIDQDQRARWHFLGQSTPKDGHGETLGHSSG